MKGKILCATAMVLNNMDSKKQNIKGLCFGSLKCVVGNSCEPCRKKIIEQTKTV